jgi:hypothetical protein
LLLTHLYAELASGKCFICCWLWRCLTVSWRELVTVKRWKRSAFTSPFTTARRAMKPHPTGRLKTLQVFVSDIDELLRVGEAGQEQRDLEVAVLKGSLAVQTFPTSDAGLLQDLLLLAGSQRIDSLHSRRKGVIERWQKTARASKGLWYQITAPFLARPVVINADSDYHADDADQWVQVERYVRGEIEDLGGHSRPNAHIRLPDGKSLTVATDREMLRSDKVNRLYKQAMVRITAEYNVVTRDYRNARLLEFVEHDNRFDEREFKRLTDRGALAWAGVEEAGAWVDEQRGNESRGSGA